MPKYLLNTKGNLSWLCCSKRRTGFYLPKHCQKEAATNKCKTVCVSIPSLSCVMLWGLSKKQCFLRRQLGKNLDACPSFLSLCINISTCARRRNGRAALTVLFFNISPTAACFSLTATGGSPREMCLQLCNWWWLKVWKWAYSDISPHKERTNSQY